MKKYAHANLHNFDYMLPFASILDMTEEEKEWHKRHGIELPSHVV